MKKRSILPLAMAMLLAMTACAAEAEETENLYRCTSYTIEYYTDGEVTSSYECTYNEAGCKESDIRYENGLVVSTTAYETDEYGNLVRSIYTDADGTQAVSEYKLTLDGQHRVLFEEYYHNGELGSTSEMAYDKNGNLIREDARWSTGDEGYTIYEYDNGKRIAQTEYVGNEIQNRYYTEYSYDETGLIEAQRKYDADGTFLRLDIITYDEYGNVLTSETGWSDEHITGEPYDGTIEIKYTYTYEPIPSAE